MYVCIYIYTYVCIYIYIICRFPYEIINQQSYLALPRKAPGLGEGEDVGNVTAGSEVAEGLCSSASEVDDFGDEAKPSIFFVGKP